MTPYRRLQDALDALDAAFAPLAERPFAVGMLDIADEIVLSCEAGYAKPDPRIYLTALDRLGAEPAA